MKAVFRVLHLWGLIISGFLHMNRSVMVAVFLALVGICFFRVLAFPTSNIRSLRLLQGVLAMEHGSADGLSETTCAMTESSTAGGVWAALFSTSCREHMLELYSGQYSLGTFDQPPFSSFNKGWGYWLRDNPELALEQWREVPNIDVYFSNIGTVLWRSGERESALAMFETSSRLDDRISSKKWGMYDIQCQYLIAEGQYKAAKSTCEIAAEGYEATGSYPLLARVYYELGYFDLTLSYLAELERSGGDQAFATYWRARTLEAMSRFEEAETEYLKGIEEHPSYPWTYLALAELYRSLGEPCKAKEVLEKTGSVPEIFSQVDSLMKSLGSPDCGPE